VYIKIEQKCLGAAGTDGRTLSDKPCKVEVGKGKFKYVTEIFKMHPGPPRSLCFKNNYLHF